MASQKLYIIHKETPHAKFNYHLQNQDQLALLLHK